MKKTVAILFMGALLILCGGLAFAETVTSTLNISATLFGSCTVTGGTLDFGSYEIGSPTDVTSNTDITVNCSNSLNYAIGLDEGLNYDGEMSRRVMVQPEVTSLWYYLCQSATCPGDDWEDLGSENEKLGTGTGTDDIHTVYGVIPAGQTPALTTGVLGDTVQITVEW